ncbi:50S ribosome-binding GTPase [Ceratobasidium sp. AG-Ba]|nr:50S ribosome-binding GTPase [Ceratobasidium sp. AG-Ba]
MTMYPAFIALFGATGTGKTTFVNDASGGGLEVGHDLDSCTRDVSFSQGFYVDGRLVYLIDTPGFDDTELSDTEVLKRISGFLTETYKNGHQLTGIIYLHRITDRRMTGVSVRNFSTFRELCGAETLSNVVLVTNMWSDPPTKDQENRETQLRDKHFQKALQQGATLTRRPRMGRDSAHEIIRIVLNKDPVVMQIQREMVRQGRNFFDTGAAQALGAELAAAEQRHQDEMAEIQEELRKAKEEKDEKAQLEKQEALDEMAANSKRVAQEIEALRLGIEEERARWRKQIEDAVRERREAERRQEELMKELEEVRRQAANDREGASGYQKQIQDLTDRIADIQGQWRCVIM